MGVVAAPAEEVERALAGTTEEAAVAEVVKRTVVVQAAERASNVTRKDT